MWTRADLKARGKLDFKRNYWACVLVSLIIAMLLGGGSGITNSINSFSNSGYKTTSTYTSNDYDLDSGLSNSLGGVQSFLSSPGVIAIIAGIGILVFLLGTVFSIFVANPLVVGGRRFYLENQYENGKLNRLGFIFKKGHYGNAVLTMFLHDLFIALWSLLLIIPGIVKGYSYWMMEYIMAENPTLSYERAFEISKSTMHGQKWDVFVLDLSFILWDLLGAITCGLVGLFYVNSYKDATSAQLYGFLRMNALNQGFATLEELPGYAPQIQPEGYQQTY